jgi:histidinol-phosphate/aromatic aminotransferase/cobyric acid decarboxylase-like protein
MTAEQFEDAMTPRTKMVIINSPGNPTGAVYSAAELAALGEIALSEDITILSDEIYEKLVYGGEKHVSIASLSQDLYNITITVNGFSKGYSMTGWRLGYTAAPRALAEAIEKIQNHTVSNACSFAQYGALAALTGDQTFVNDMAAEYDVRRQFMLARLRAISDPAFEIEFRPLPNPHLLQVLKVRRAGPGRAGLSAVAHRQVRETHVHRECGGPVGLDEERRVRDGLCRVGRVPFRFDGGREEPRSHRRFGLAHHRRGGGEHHRPVRRPQRREAIVGAVGVDLLLL